MSKSAGYDDMHPIILRKLSDVLAAPLKILFDKTLKEGKIPQSWERAEVKPIFKKGDKNNPGNYRPVRLTSIVCKTIEGFIRDALSKHLKTNGLLSNHQHGFTTGRSCITQLLTTLHDWFSMINDGKPVDAIYLDLQKAFDKDPHRRFLTKLEGHGVHGQILCWIEDFLSNRT